MPSPWASRASGSASTRSCVPIPDSAATFAAPTWVVAHLAAVVGFVLLVVGTGAVRAVTEGVAAERLAFRAMLVTGAGVGLTLPYYGAEAFGLHAVGEWSLARRDDAVLALADGFRYAPAAATTFVLGLVLLGVGGVRTALAVGRSARSGGAGSGGAGSGGSGSRSASSGGASPDGAGPGGVVGAGGAGRAGAGVPLALGMLLFVPQFFAAPGLRVAHGVLMLVGCLVLARATWVGASSAPSRPPLPPLP